MMRLSALSICGLMCGLLALGSMAETEAPAAAEAPVAKEAPAATEVPVAKEAPTATEAPVATEAPASLDEILGKSFVNAQGETVDAEALKGKTVIGIYFSAHWCPPCRQFTPLLVKAAEDLKAENKPFEVVFVSRDRNQEAMSGYMKDSKMPWLAIPFGDAKIQELVTRYKIRGIPSLVIIDGNGKTITTQGRGPIASQGAKAFDGWAAPEK